MGAADLDHVVELVRLGARARRAGGASAGSRSSCDRGVGRDVDRGRDDVVRRLAGVDVVVRDGPASSSRRTPPSISIARFEITSLAFMLVEVPEPVWKMSSGKWRVELAVEDLARGAPGSPRARARVDDAHLGVDRRALALDQPERGDEAALKDQPGDREVAPRALGLRAPVGVARDFDLAQTVLLHPTCLHRTSIRLLSGFVDAIDRELGSAQGGDRELVGALVLGVSVVPAQPEELDLMHVEQSQQLLPEIGVQRRLLVGLAPAVVAPLPRPTLLDRLDDVLRVAPDLDPPAALQRLRGPR